jgi:hypothetical protein
MYIPVTYGSGTVSTTVTADLSGVLNVNATVTYNGTTYQPNTDINVKQNDSFTISTSTTTSKTIPVSYLGKTFDWCIVTPPAAGRYYYLDDASKLRQMTGTSYGKFISIDTDTAAVIETPYTPTQTFTPSDVTTVFDYVKKDVWFFSATNEVKKATLTSMPIASVYTPLWTQDDTAVAYDYIVTENSIIPVNADFSLNNAAAFAIPANARYATSNQQSQIIVAYDDKINVYSAVSTVISLVHSYPMTNLNPTAIFTDIKDVIWVTNNKGIYTWLSGNLTTRFATANSVFTSIASDNQIDTTIASKVWVVDAYNNRVITFNNLDYTYTIEYETKFLATGVSSDNSDEYIASLSDNEYFDNGVLKSAPDVNFAYASTALNKEFYITSLYTDITPPFLVYQPKVGVVVQTLDIPLNTAKTISYTLSFARAQFVQFDNIDGFTVQYNGQAFTSGYLENGAVLSITCPAFTNYYDSRVLQLLSEFEPITFVFRSIPNLVPNPITLPSATDVFPGTLIETDSQTITGMTEGFTCTLTTKEPGILQFAIDKNGTGTDADFIDTGTVGNGHTIDIRYLMQMMAQTRSYHYIDDAYGNHIVTLQALPIPIQGVVKYEVEQQLEDNIYMLNSQPTKLPETTEIVQGVGSTQDSVVAFFDNALVTRRWTQPDQYYDYQLKDSTTVLSQDQPIPDVLDRPVFSMDQTILVHDSTQLQSVNYELPDPRRTTLTVYGNTYDVTRTDLQSSIVNGYLGIDTHIESIDANKFDSGINKVIAATVDGYPLSRPNILATSNTYNSVVFEVMYYAGVAYGNTSNLNMQMVNSGYSIGVQNTAPSYLTQANYIYNVSTIKKAVAFGYILSAVNSAYSYDKWYNMTGYQVHLAHDPYFISYGDRFIYNVATVKIGVNSVFIPINNGDFNRPSFNMSYNTLSINGSYSYTNSMTSLKPTNINVATANYGISSTDSNSYNILAQYNYSLYGSQQQVDSAYAQRTQDFALNLWQNVTVVIRPDIHMEGVYRETAPPRSAVFIYTDMTYQQAGQAKVFVQNPTFMVRGITKFFAISPTYGLKSSNTVYKIDISKAYSRRPVDKTIANFLQYMVYDTSIVTYNIDAKTTGLGSLAVAKNYVAEMGLDPSKVQYFQDSQGRYGFLVIPDVATGIVCSIIPISRNNSNGQRLWIN